MSRKKIHSYGNFDKIIERTRYAFAMKTDRELAQLFELSPANFNNRKHKGTLLDEVIKYTLEYHPEINLHWLLTGQGEIHCPETPSQKDNVHNFSLEDLKAKFKNPALADHICRKLLEIEEMDESKLEYMKGVVDNLHAMLEPMKKKVV